MKIKLLALVIVLIHTFSPVGNVIVAGNSNNTKPVISLAVAQIIDTQDTVLFDLSSLLFISSSIIEIPVSILSNDTVNALDFSMKFDESIITYDTLINYKSYLFALTNFNTTDRTLRFTSSSLSPIDHNTRLAGIRFQLSGPCKNITPADFNTIKVYLNGDQCSFKVTNASNYLPLANFTNNKACSGTNITFNDASTAIGGTINSWLWNLGNGNTSVSPNPVTSYTVAGIYTVTLVATSNSGCSDTISKAITVNPFPTVNFTSVADCQTSSITFTDSSAISSGVINSWAWNFGDGGSSSLQNPSHSYASGGNYSVSLTAGSDSGCTSVYTNTVIINSPTAKFTMTNGCIGSTINFTDSSTSSFGTITNWSWLFGDGNFSIQQTPSHLYAAPGTYTVSLRIITSQGCMDSITELLTIENKPVVKFGGDNLSGCMPLTVNFSDSSLTVPGSSYFWDFGDATNSSSINAVHTYSASGTYTVTHIVIATVGCIDSLVKAAYITVHDKPITKFATVSGCIGSAINFTDSSSSSNAISNWNWIFGDGNNSVQQNPSHIYVSGGTYSVSLNVTTNQGCSDSLTKTIIIENKPIVEFKANILSGCAPLNVYFSDSSIASSGSSYFWSFGDTGSSSSMNIAHTYTTNGTYHVRHIVITSAGCTDSLVKTSYINVSGPTASFQASVDTALLPNASVSFINLTSGYITTIWNFGDSTSSNQKNPLHTFTNAGIYRVCMTVEDSAGCIDTYCDTIVILNSNPVAIPKAFTPNEDNVNDVLRVKGGPFSEMELRIFNEWGNQVFLSTLQEEGWDGTYKETPQPGGLYIYTLKGKTTDNSSINMHGVVNLMR